MKWTFPFSKASKRVWAINFPWIRFQLLDEPLNMNLKGTCPTHKYASKKKNCNTPDLVLLAGETALHIHTASSSMRWTMFLCHQPHLRTNPLGRKECKKKKPHCRLSCLSSCFPPLLSSKPERAEEKEIHTHREEKGLLTVTRVSFYPRPVCIVVATGAGQRAKTAISFPYQIGQIPFRVLDLVKRCIWVSVSHNLCCHTFCRWNAQCLYTSQTLVYQ